MRSIAYRSFFPQKADIAKFGKMGVHLFCVFPGNTLNSLGAPYSNYPPNWIHQGVYDWDAADRQFDDMIEADPEARFLCMVDLNTPPWLARWLPDKDDSFLHLGKVAASKAWRKATGEYLEAFLLHVESKYASRVEGCVLMCGMTDEWQDYSKGEESASRCDAWREWSRERGYGDPVDIPPKSLRYAAAHGLFRDPQSDAAAIRYWDFSRSLVASSILHFASKAKALLKGRAQVGVFYGYVFEHSCGGLNSMGHLGFDRVFSSPDVDFIISPSSYQDRQIGGASAFMLTVDSLKLHGKGFFREIDHFTPTSNGNPLASLGVKEDRMASWNHRWPDEKSAIAGLRREFSLDLIHGVSFWWFDMWNHWYETEALLSAMASMRRIWDAQSALGEAKGSSRIAVLADSESCLYLNENDGAVADVLYKLRPELGRLGAPYSVFSFADLEAIDFSQFKLVVFPNLFLCGAERLEKLRQTVLKDGRTVLWINRAGVVADGRYDLANIESLTGVPFAAGSVGRRDFGSWKSVLRCDFLPDWRFLRSVAQEAGVHLYGEGGEPVYANERLLASHSATGGVRKFRLPKRSSVVKELFTDRIVAKDCAEFEDILETPGTVLYELID